MVDAVHIDMARCNRMAVWEITCPECRMLDTKLLGTIFANDLNTLFETDEAP